MMTLTQQIKDVDLVALVESEGINLNRQGSNFIGLCPFHDDTKPSMNVFRDNHFKCWACGEYGDSLDFIMRLHGFSTKEALKHLGINHGAVTADKREQIAEAVRKRKEKRVHEQRRRNLLYTLAVEIRKARKVLANIRNDQQMESAAGLFHRLPFWEHCYEVLIHGGRGDVQAVLDALNGFKLINRMPLFKLDFDYRQWLRGFTHGRAVNAT